MSLRIRARSLQIGLIPGAECSAIILSMLLLTGCGYQFRVEGAGPTIGGTSTPTSSSPPPRLVIRTLENKSFEPNLETRYTNYLRHEFSSGSGAQIVPESEAADLVLTGQILSVTTPTLSFTQTTTLESRTEVIVLVKSRRHAQRKWSGCKRPRVSRNFL